ncbi:MAG: MFS transporter [Anaerolineales bacterium]|nr:MFS transporter [Anaerolineales bacterium]
MGRRLIGYFSLFICIGLDMALTGPALPALAAQTGSTVAAMGTIFIVGAGGVSLGTLLGGWLFDRIPGRRILVIGQCVVAASIFLTPHIPWFGVLMVLIVVKGIAGGAVHCGANTLLLWTFEGKAGPYVNALHFFFGLGAFLSPFLFGLLIDAGRVYAEAYHILAVVGLLVALVMGGTVVAPAPKPKAAGAAAEAGGGWSVAPLVISAMLFLFFYVSGEITFGGWVFTYARTLNLADAAHAAYLTSVFWLAFTVGRLLSIPAAVRFRPAQIIPAALAGVAAFLGLLIVFPGSPAALWTAAAGTGFCMAPVWPTGFTLAGQSVRLTARITGFILLGDSLGGMVLPGLTGWIMESAGAPAMPRLVLTAAALTFLAFLGIVVFGKKGKPAAVPA